MRLPIFPETPLPVIQTSDHEDRGSSCLRCKLHQYTPDGKRCLPPDGDPGDILVISDYPGEFELRLQRPMAGAAGRWLRDLFARVAPDRKVVYTNALGCRPPKGEDDLEEYVDLCRLFAAQDLIDADPKIVILMGPWAGYSFFGSTYQPLSIRTGYGWFYKDGDPRPVFYMPNPAAAIRNRLVAKAFEEDLVKALSASPSSELLGHTYTVVDTEEASSEALEQCFAAPYVATDVETSGMMHESDFRIECVAISTGQHNFVWPRHAIESKSLRESLLTILSDCDHTSWNGQYDWKAFACDPLFSVTDAKSNVTSPLRLMSDARVKRKLIEADVRADLGTAAHLIGMGGHKQEAHTLLKKICAELSKYAMSFELTPTGKVRKTPDLKYIDPSIVSRETLKRWFEYLKQGFEPEKFAYRFMPQDIILRYCARDALTTWHLEDWCNAHLIQDEGLADIWSDVCQPAMWAYCQMSMNGLPLDASALKLFQSFLETEMSKVLAKIHGYSPGLNPGSTKQVGAYLSSVGIHPHRKTAKLAPSYSDESLEEYKDKHPMVDLVLQYRELQKQHGTYAVGYGAYIRSDGCIHPSILADGTESGRPSSQAPNLFNVSKGRTERKRLLADLLRSCFVCPPGHSMVEVDAGQIEIRGASHLSGDPEMHAMLTSGTDFHMASAKKFAEAQGKDPTAVSDLDRERAKTSNFAAVYEIPCQLGFMLSKRLDIETKQGEELATAMFRSYKRLRQWFEEQYASAYEQGYCRTVWKGKAARKRPLWGMGYNPPTLSLLETKIQAERKQRKDQNKSEDAVPSLDLNAARSTWNTPVQGSSVDVISSHLWEVHLWLKENTKNGKLVLQVYDSIMVIVADDEVEKTIKFIKSVMTAPLFGNTPLTADAKAGKNWGAMQKVKVQ